MIGSVRIGLQGALILIDNSDVWLTRAQEVLKKPAMGIGIGSETAQFAISMLSALYGSESPQMKHFQTHFAAIQKTTGNPGALDTAVGHHARAVIRNTILELEAGLIVKLRVAVEGEVLGEMIQLAKEVLSECTEAAKNASAVLIAAAYEGLMRKMGEEFAGVKDRPKLEVVIGALKTAGVLKGSDIAIAQSYLKFRNDSLHADWKLVERPQIDACLAFSESLLTKHFS
jgi:hypothetical protein